MYCQPNHAPVKNVKLIVSINQAERESRRSGISPKTYEPCRIISKESPVKQGHAIALLNKMFTMMISTVKGPFQVIFRKGISRIATIEILKISLKSICLQVLPC